MTDRTTVRVRPWPGLILDGIPPAGADIPRALAEDWTANHLVVPLKDEAPVKTAEPARKTRRTR